MVMDQAVQCSSDYFWICKSNEVLLGILQNFLVLLQRLFELVDFGYTDLTLYDVSFVVAIDDETGNSQAVMHGASIAILKSGNMTYLFKIHTMHLQLWYSGFFFYLDMNLLQASFDDNSQFMVAMLK